MHIPDFEYRQIKPGPALSNYVESFWILSNRSNAGKEVVILPDGRIDLSFSWTNDKGPHAMLMGLDTGASAATFPAHTTMLAISFRPPGAECFFDEPFAAIAGSAKEVSPAILDLDPGTSPDLEKFSESASQRLMQLLPEKADDRKQKLFELIYASNGSATVKELSEQVHWSSRQINRYFSHTFGVSLKTYCTILRFRASFGQIKEGKLFPGQQYADQAHFIREIRKFSGVAPKQLSKNKNGQFIQISTLPKE